MLSSTPACCLPVTTTGGHSQGQRKLVVLPPRHTCLRTKAAVKVLGSHGGRGPLQALKVQLRERSSACGHSKQHPAKAPRAAGASGAPMPSSTRLSPGEPCTAAWWLSIQRLVCTQH